MSAARRPHEPADVIVVGAGIIGLAIARRARRCGLEVTVLERDSLGAGASSVAAGMLAPVAEVEFGAAGRTQLELGMLSAQLWPALARELAQESGVELELGGSETLFVARDPDEAEELERQLEFRRSLGLPVRRVRASEAREREPALAPGIRMALALGGERTVDPRRVLEALAASCARAGVRLRERTPVSTLALDGDERRVRGVRLADGELIEAERVVLAAGAWASELAGGRPVVRPVKGQILRLRDPAGPGLLRGVVRFVGGYLVPRGDGRYVLGATVEDRGFDASPTAGAVHELLCDAREVVPGIDELEIEELSVGFRPGSPDNLPLLGSASVEGLVWAGGHYRNGVLLTPVTAELIAGVLAPGAAGSLDPDQRERLLAACSPARFGAPAHARGPGAAARALATTGAQAP